MEDNTLSVVENCSHMLDHQSVLSQNLGLVKDVNENSHGIDKALPTENVVIVKYSDSAEQIQILPKSGTESSTVELNNDKTDSSIMEKTENTESTNVSNQKDFQPNIDVNEILEKILYQENVIEQNTEGLKVLEEKNKTLEGLKKDLEFKLENANKQKELAIKEKENMVIRYAVGEKNILKERQMKEQAEKKCKEFQKEIEFLQHKLQTMISEKARIGQMLDNKCYEHKNVQQELDKAKQDLNNLETKLKWNQNSLKTEMEAHKECQIKVEALSTKIQDSVNEIEQAKKNAEETIKNFMTSQENKAYVLDQQVKEQQALLILLRHEKSDRDQQIKTFQSELERLHSKQKDTIEENNNLSLKVQHLERERLENEQKLSELRGYQDQQRQDAANLQTKTVQFEQLKLQLKHEQEQLEVSNEQMSLLKQRNQELESDMESCRIREAELLLFTQQLTDKNVRLQSEFTTVETKVQQLTCEQGILKRQIKEQETKISMLSATLAEERTKLTSENECLKRNLEETQKKIEAAIQEIGDQKGENLVLKRKFDLNLREVNKELHHCRKKLEQYESNDSSSNTSSSSSTLNVNGHSQNSADIEQVKVIQPEPTIDKQTLIEHIVKLQRISAKKSEKIDFLEEHINTLVSEVQKKTKLLQGYVLREQSGTLTSNAMDNNKAKLAKLNGVMASMYSNKICDETLTLELSLDINRKLQAVLEDALLKNMTLKENVETLGSEIDRLNNLRKNS
ncbi:coiled-coil domain-containing protein 186 [Sitophilus oryzae]|uniref:Coiled-coil domain-containing protein 186 n=1 Tax=Sitophilus oryzae TaxID=7048 RepID=A0A6J2YPY9_SITOR|nr:coiled-coil domain-containing protein 186 [Sitophilus oryzae]